MIRALTLIANAASVVTALAVVSIVGFDLMTLPPETFALVGGRILIALAISVPLWFFCAVGAAYLQARKV